MENSLGKLATNGLLDKYLLTLTPHILTFTANHCLVSFVEGECSNSTRRHSIATSLFEYLNVRLPEARDASNSKVNFIAYHLVDKKRQNDPTLPFEYMSQHLI